VLKGASQFQDVAERGATVVADVCLPGVAEQKVEIFCLPGFVEDHRQMCFSRGNPSCFFFHMRVLREEGNRGRKRSKKRKATEEGRGARERTTTTDTPLLVCFFTPPTTHQPALSINQEP
jgi:hypothetical protein